MPRLVQLMLSSLFLIWGIFIMVAMAFTDNVVSAITLFIVGLLFLLVSLLLSEGS